VHVVVAHRIEENVTADERRRDDPRLPFRDLRGDEAAKQPSAEPGERRERKNMRMLAGIQSRSGELPRKAATIASFTYCQRWSFGKAPREIRAQALGKSA
jgi:hypothetical protein